MNHLHCLLRINPSRCSTPDGVRPMIVAISETVLPSARRVSTLCSSSVVHGFIPALCELLSRPRLADSRNALLSFFHSPISADRCAASDALTTSPILTALVGSKSGLGNVRGFTLRNGGSGLEAPSQPSEQYSRLSQQGPKGFPHARQ